MFITHVSLGVFTRKKKSSQEIFFPQLGARGRVDL
jgi:hypothetical protein